MKAAKEIQVRDVSGLDVSQDLKEQIQIVSGKCIKCKLCEKECAFLRKYGKPKDIADSYDPADKVHQGMPFECSLCQLCASVCPVKINPALMFLDMRRETVRRGNGDYPEHGPILGYEKRGTSQKYTYYSLPAGCDTVFFPGCTLPGTRPDKVKRIFEHMKKTVPFLGIVLDCCTKPSHDLGRDSYFHSFFDEMKEFLVTNGIRNVIVACPSCHNVFKRYGNELFVSTVYEFMAVNGLPEADKVSGTISIHDSCAVRYEESILSAIRDLISRKGLTVEEMPHSGKKTLCCGEGGSVGFLSQDLARNWGILRKKESDGKRLIAYCAGCANFLNSLTPICHIIDLLLEPESAISGRAKVAKAPFTYLNRLKLKKYFKKTVNGAVTRERTFVVGE
jgi:Fe-S oxidoreductase